MENQIQVFYNPKHGQVRGYIDKNGTAYLNVEDVARGLGFTQIKNGVEYVRYETVNNYLNEFGYNSFSQLVGKEDFIPENMVYRLAMKAKNEIAEDFQVWLADDVVPTIRRTGGYSLKKIDYKALLKDRQFVSDLVYALQAEQEENARLAEENAILTQQVFEMAPKAKYYDLILQCPHAIPVTIIAKDYGMSSKKFNQLLNKLGVQYKVDGTWVLYSYYENRGWTTTKTHRFDRLDGTHDSHILTCWTQQGRQGLYELLKLKGYLPLIELNNN